MAQHCRNLLKNADSRAYPIKNMKTDIFDFELPKELIAQQPASPRDSARLLHVGNVFTDLCVRDLPRLFSPGDVLVLNNTKVIPARLRGKRHETSIEITLHKLNRDGSWCAFARPARKLKAGYVINFAEDFSARISQN